MIGSVASGLADYISSSPPRKVKDKDRAKRTPRDDDLAYGDENRKPQRRSDRPKSLFSRIATTLADSRSSKKQRRHLPDDQHARRRPQSFEDRPIPGTQFVFVEEYTSSEESESSDESDDDGDDFEDLDDLIEALENTVERYEEIAELSRRQLESKCRHGMTSPQQLQKLAQDVEDLDFAKDRAARRLGEARAQKMAQEQRERQHHQSTRRERTTTSDFEDNLFNDPFFRDVFGPPRQHGHTHRRSVHVSGSSAFDASPFAAFDSLFANLRSMHGSMHQQVFEMPGMSSSRSSTAQSHPSTARPQASRPSTTRGPSPRRARSSYKRTAYTAPRATPPSTMLKPEEAQNLFESYADRWGTLAATGPKVPYPARGLKSTNLVARDTLWAPSVRSPVDTWSEETVMKANTHAFFLGAVGMSPSYSEGPGATIQLGIDKASGSSAQLQQLVTMLKKERVRWHSDRLGKRNAGNSGTNEALQNDTRARAVYHGVCELLEAAQ